MTEEEYGVLKRLICRLLRLELVEDETGDLVAGTALRSSGDKQSETMVVVTDEALRAHVNKLGEVSIDGGLDYVTPNHYEHLVRFGSLRAWRLRDRRTDPFFSTSDTHNGITYELGTLSLEHCLTLLIRYSMLLVGGQIDSVPRLFAQRGPFRPDYGDGEGDGPVPWETMIRSALRLASVKVVSDKALSQSKLKELADAYAFTLMYRTGDCIGEYQDIQDALSYGSVRYYIRYGIDDIDTPPAMTYEKDVIDYYSLALSSDDVYVRYISFYHVLEFHFERVFRKEMSQLLRDMIVRPDFSYTSDAKLYGVVKTISKELRATHDRGFGNEEKELGYVLKAYVNMAHLRTRIEEIERGAQEFYEREKCPFTQKKTTVDWSSDDDALKAIVKRVYETRNALIHSKDRDDTNSYRYRPYKDEKKLRKELPLIQALAEQVIIGSGKVLKV